MVVRVEGAAAVANADIEFAMVRLAGPRSDVERQRADIVVRCELPHSQQRSRRARKHAGRWILGYPLAQHILVTEFGHIQIVGNSRVPP